MPLTISTAAIPSQIKCPSGRAAVVPAARPRSVLPATRMAAARPLESPAGAVAIDGSMLEGGGQILRYATALAAITGQAVVIDRIRAGRKVPGLSPQHLTGLRLVEQMSGGHLGGGAARSEAISFAPGALKAGSYTADTHTAGSCTLMVQQALPCLLFAAPGSEGPGPPESRVTLRGGTDADFAPPIGYLQHVFAPTLRRLTGATVQVDLVRRGFYPKGGGEVVLTASGLPAGQALPAWNLADRGELRSITLHAFGAGRVPANVAQRMADSARADLVAGLGAAAADVAFDLQVVPHEPEGRAVGEGCGILLVAETSRGCLLGASARGERGVTAEAVGSIAAASLLADLASGACVDEHLQDQLVVFMALAGGSGRLLCSDPPSLHTRTAMVVAELLLPGASFSVKPAGQGLSCIECRGAGVVRA